MNAFFYFLTVIAIFWNVPLHRKQWNAALLYQPFLSQICCRSFSGACSCGRCVWGVGTAGTGGCLQGVLYFYTLTKIAFYAVAICVTGCLELIEVKEEVGEQQRHIGKMGCVRMTNATQFRQLGLWECARLNHVSSQTLLHSASFFQIRIVIKSVFCTNTQSRFASAVLPVTWDLIA